MANYVPAGKTSIIKRSDISYQLQTEYAYRPYPRITTTILHEGQVIKKIERRLDNPIESIEEQNRVQDIIQIQHNEVFKLIREDSPIQRSTPIIQPKQTIEHPLEIIQKTIVEEKKAQAQNIPDDIEIIKVTDRKSIQERFSSIPGIEHVYQLDNLGEFKTGTAQKHFRKDFKKTFKIITELLEIFPVLDQDTSYRESGVYEVEKDRLYLVSQGKECYFVSIIPEGTVINYEESIKECVFGLHTY